MKYLVLCAMCTVGCVGNDEVIAVSEQMIYRKNTHTDVGWWAHDDNDGADSVYVSFNSKEFKSADEYGVFVEMPDCAPQQTFVVSFDGLARGDFEYRASLRLTVKQGDVVTPIPGAQVYLTPIPNVTSVHIGGAFIPAVVGRCHVGLVGKTFTNGIELFGAATLLVQRHR